MRLKAFCTSVSFGMLLIVAACQKIDAYDLEQSAGAGDNDAVEEPGGTSGGGADADNRLEQQPDGSLLYPTDGHVIALLTRNADGEGQALLISQYEWADVASALNETDGGQAAELAAKYSEGGMSGWRIPTRDEAASLRALYECGVADDATMTSDTLKALNRRLEALGGTPLRAWERSVNYTPYRYLCEDGTYTFSLKKGSNITKSGKKSHYHLRLVRDSVITESYDNM